MSASRLLCVSARKRSKERGMSSRQCDVIFGYFEMSWFVGTSRSVTLLLSSNSVLRTWLSHVLGVVAVVVVVRVDVHK